MSNERIFNGRIGACWIKSSNKSYEVEHGMAMLRGGRLMTLYHTVRSFKKVIQQKVL